MTDYVIGDWRKLGAVLRDMRRRRGLTQTELATQAGVSRAWLAKLEAGGHRRAEMEHVLRLLSGLEVDMVLRDPLDESTQVPDAGASFTVESGDGSALPDEKTAVVSRTGSFVPSSPVLDAMRARSVEADDRMRAARAALADTRKARDLVNRHQRLIEEVRRKV